MSTVTIMDIGARTIGEDEPLTSWVSPFVFVSAPADPTSDQRMLIVEASGTLDFWDRPEEDIYSLDDGEPV